jgi:hypothetical protein
MKATLMSIEKGQTLYYTRVTNPSGIHVVNVDDITNTHYSIRFTHQSVYDVKKHIRSIDNYYHTLESAIEACQKKVINDYNRLLRQLEDQHITNLQEASNNVIYWHEVTK